VVAGVEVKTLDSALRKSLSGYADALQGKSDSEVAMLKDAEKKRRESVNKLRNRHSILHGDGAAAGLKVTQDEGQTIEQEARRQSVAVLKEFKQLVEAAENEVSEGGRGAEAAVAAAESEEEASSFKERGSDGDTRRESMALDQALIRQMLPRKVCVPLRQGKKVPPEAFQGVSIFFSDVVGFTTISSEVEPIKVHELLNTLFTVMDYCTAMFPLYKVETIGDAYMVAGGLPEPNENNAQDLADFALLVSAAVAACVKSPIDGSPIMIRMGCHTGNVMAGVVGTLMPRYCLFGDTVNTASRMESNGSPGEIHCSDDFAAKLRGKGRHVLEERGEIEIKGKGVMRTHWLRGPSSVNDVSSSSAVEQVIADVRDLLAERESFGDEGGV
jgi:class 3 adenylate cyclase